MWTFLDKQQKVRVFLRTFILIFLTLTIFTQIFSIIVYNLYFYTENDGDTIGDPQI